MHFSWNWLPPLQTVVRPARTGLCRFSSVTHRGLTGSHRISTVATTHAGLLRCRPVVLRWRYGSCRKSYGDATGKAGVVSHPGSSRWSPVVLKILKPPGPLPGERRFNTVYPDSMRCLSASLRCGPGGSRCPHRSAAATENRDSVNEALKCLSALTNKTWVRCFNCSSVARWFFITYRST